jgi:glycosyltransferase involved in cell wall biosynthesis
VKLKSNQNYLLATYNFFPFAGGGSEVYVLNQARYLKSKGCYIKIFAAVPLDHGKEVIFQNNQIEICEYEHEGFSVWGLSLIQKTSRKSIYSKHVKGYTGSIQKFFQEHDSKFTNLEMHGFTAAIGINLIEAFREEFSNSFIRYYNHTAINCPKGTLLKDGKECAIVPSVAICSNCLQNEYKDSYIDRTISKLLKNIQIKYFPAKWSRQSLVRCSINSFLSLSLACNEIIVFSGGMYNRLVDTGVPKNKMRIIRHGVNETFLISKSSSPPIKSVLNFGYVGRFDEIKGFDTLALAWLNLPENPNVRTLFIAGKTIENENLLIRKLKLRSDVIFEGYVDQQKLIQFLDNVQFLIVPSLCFETGPLVIHEAVSRGCKIIGSNIGGVKELCELYGQTTFEVNHHIELYNLIYKAAPFIRTRKKSLTFTGHFDLLFDDFK